MSSESPTPERDLLQIGEVADRVGLSLRTVRYYEEVGLLAPTTRSEGGFRLFDRSQLDRLLLIKRMKPIGMSLDEMRILLDARDSLRAGDDAPAGAARERLHEFVTMAEERCREFESQLRSTRELAEQIRTELGQAEGS